MICKSKRHCFYVPLFIVITFSGCATLERIKDDFNNTFIKPKDSSTATPSTSLSNERPTATSQTSLQIPRIINDPANAIDVSKYRTNIVQPISNTLSRSKPASAITNIRELTALVDALKAVSEDPFLQVKAIHDWVALTIQYDAASFFSGNLPDQSWQAVLRSGKGVCEGYANVLDQMLRISGFPTSKVSGYARGVGSNSLAPEDPRKSNHAWNMVKIQNYWYLLDSTWDSGYMDGKVAQRAYSTAYFLIKPEWIIYTHFPSRVDWQLLAKPVTPAEFTNMPDLSGKFFDYVSDGYQTLGLKMALREPAQINLQVKTNFKFKAVLYDAAGREANYGFVQQQDGTLKIYMAPPPGTWLLRLFAAPINNNRYESIAELVIDSSNTSQVSIPVLFADYQTHKARLISPFFKALKAGSSEEFLIYIENIAKAFLQVNGRHLEMEPRGGNIYALQVAVPASGTIDVFIQKNSNSNMQSGLLRIPIIP